MRTPPVAIRQPRAARLLPLAASIALAFAPAAHAATIVVDTTDELGVPGTTTSLRDAINQANSNCGTDPSPLIQFAIATGPFVIAPSSPLGFLCVSGDYTPTIDGYSQSGIIIDGSNFFYGFDCGVSWGSFFYGGNLTVQGLKIRNFSYGGFTTGVCGELKLFGNVIANNTYGANLQGNSQVGGSTSEEVEGNIFTGNSDTGIWVSSGGNVRIERNLVGTPNGSSADGNGNGIYVGGGGTHLITDNVISGNSTGIYVYDDYGGSVISFNTVGTNAKGSTALANTGDGVLVRYSRGLSISGNHISGNGNAGIAVDDSSINIIGNRIGSDSGGGTLPNTLGIDASCSGTHNLKIEDNEILTNLNEGIFLSIASFGGSASIERNNVSDNGGTGLRIDGTSCGYGGTSFVADGTFANNGVDGILLVGSTVGNTISANSIYGNGRKNINLNSGSSFLPNDSGDIDGGANNQQNWPVIVSVVHDGVDTTVVFHMNDVPGDYTIEAFSNPSLGNPAGATFLGTFDYTAFSSGTGIFSVSGTHDYISLTATTFPPGGDTSEYSEMKAAPTALAASAVVVRPAVLDFGSLQVGSTSAARASTLTSIGDQAYEIDVISSSSGCYGGPICYGGSFICQHTCDTATSYGRNQSCQISARFSPQFPGFTSTTIYICDNASGSPRSILLQGNGVLPPPIVVSPTSWDFGNVPVGVLSTPAGFTVRNQSPSSISLGPITATGEFELLDSTCGSSLAYGASCDANVAFLPTQSGPASGELVVPYVECCSEFATAQGGKVSTPQSVRAALTGNGVSGGELTLPSSIEVGAASVGGGPISTTVELVNTGNAPVTISEVTVSSPFTVVNNCTTPLAPGTTCTLVIGFTAPDIGSFNGSLTVISDASGGSGEIPVHATGQAIAAPLIVVSPFSMGFGDRIIGSSTSPQAITITNIGGVTATLSLATSSVDFIIGGNNCGATLEPRASCFAQVAFRPLGFGLRVGSFVVTSNSAGSPQSVSLSGTGCRPYLVSGNRSGVPSNCAP